MLVLGIESSCDETAAAVVEDGKKILSSVTMTQIAFHKPYNGVVPELASRKHTEWIYDVVQEALNEASLKPGDINGAAVTNRPGLLGSLLVGVNFAKAFAYALKIPLAACNHILSHLYAACICEAPPPYPFLGLLVSGGHTLICKVHNFDSIEILGTTIDDAAGEAFDKVAKHFDLGYPGGKYIDELAKQGDGAAFAFPLSNLHKGEHRCDVSYSGLKTAVINQTEQFRRKGTPGIISKSNLAASFQKAACDILLRALFNAIEDTGINTVVAGGGVAANSYLRSALAARGGLNVIFPDMELCTDNAAMVAGLGYHYLLRGDNAPLSLTAHSRVEGFKKKYP